MPADAGYVVEVAAHQAPQGLALLEDTQADGAVGAAHVSGDGAAVGGGEGAEKEAVADNSGSAGWNDRSSRRSRSRKSRT